MTQPGGNLGAPANFFGDSPPESENLHGFARLRTSNDAPLDSEIPLIHGIISNREVRLDTLETQVRDLEVTLADLVQRRDEAAEYLREHRAILHPLRRAPPELVCEIFALALDTPDDSDNGSGVGYTPPWYLGQVCRSWRRWALAYPRLWSYITIPSSPTPSRDHAVFEALLLRSSNWPLDVCWTALVDQYAEHQRPVDRELADLALAHCDRWATLRLDISIDPAADSLDWLHPAKGCLTSLRRLDVVSPGNTVQIPDVFSGAPSLCQVLLTDWKLAYYSPDIQIPWDQITHYRGAFQELSQLNILRTAPKLVQCAISFETSDADAVTPDESRSVVLYQLRRLNIEQPHFLHHLTAPSLEELYCMYVQYNDMAALLPFVCRSNCLLQKLVLTGCYISPDLITALRGLPSLGYLLIAVKPNASVEEHIDLLRQLEITDTAQNLCPGLSSLVYGISHRFPQEVFSAMIRSRMRPSHQGSRLTYLRIFDPFARSDIRSATRELSGEGFDADVLTKTEFDLLTGKGFFP
ncbi:hypothetical protein DFH06DRAFT_1296651 [Mycena polygramma]|nr:hypothetical protein DFH06DRAFT_1296651 [Mycena polygramma]